MALFHENRWIYFKNWFIFVISAFPPMARGRPPRVQKNTVFLRLPIYRPFLIFTPKIHLYLPFLRGPHFSILNFFLCQRQKKAGKPVFPIIMSPSPTVNFFILSNTSNLKRLLRVNKSWSP